MSERKYTEQHEYVSVDGTTGTIGISDYAQEQLGDIVYVELPEVGATIAHKGQIAVVESVKAASEVYAPVGGEVIEVNEALNDQPEMVNADAMGAGWLAKLTLADAGQLDGLMDEAAHAEYVKGLE